MVNRHRLLPAWLCTVLMLLFGDPVSAARIQVSLDRNPVPLNEGFTMIFTSDESPDGDPVFEPLEQDFEILAGPLISSNRTLVNGRASQHYEWQLTVMAKRAGTLEIPPVAFGANRSEPFSVTVLPVLAKPPHGSSDGAVLLEVEAEPKNPYVQAQSLYTIRVLSRVAMGEAHLSGPEAANSLIQKLDGEQNGITTRNGVQYRFTVIRYAVFPQRSGPLRIEPVKLEVQIATGGGRSLFDPFFRPATKTQRFQSEPVELSVRPIPAAFTGQHWLPASHLELEDSWAGKPPSVAAGEPATRTLSIRVEGATVGVLPELGQALPNVAGVKLYPDQPLLKEEKLRDGFSSLRREKTALIASRPGTYRLPAVEVPWWNTQTDRMEMARLAERVLTVQPSVETSKPEPATPTPAPASVPEPLPAGKSPPSAVSAAAPAGNTWPWVALFLGLGWLGTAFSWWFGSRRRVAGPVPSLPEGVTERPLIAAIERACRKHDPVAARRALVGWARHRWPGSGAQGTEALELSCDADLRKELEILKRVLYTQGGNEWRGESLWRSFQAYVGAEKTGKNSRGVPELEPLYRL